MANNRLSSLALFDDIRRRVQGLTGGSTEEEFLKVIEVQEKFRLESIALEQEAERIRQELDMSLQSIADLETKLFNARRLLEEESQARKKAENERDILEHKILAAADILQHEKNLRNETRDKLALLHALPRKKKTMSCVLEEPPSDDSNQINSTGSILSELSITTSDDDSLNACSGVGRANHFKKRTSIQDIANDNSKKKRSIESIKMHRGIIARRISNHGRSRAATIKEQKQRQQQQQQQQLNLLGGTAVGAICATTKVTIPQDGNGPIETESTIQRMPAAMQRECNEI